MNRIINSCKREINRAINLVKGDDNLLRRYATTIADYKITWIPPEKRSNSFDPMQSGDEGLEIEIKSSDFCNMYDKSPELKDASDIVKKMFTLRFLPRKEMFNVRRKKVMDLVRRHKLDHKSPEAEIAYMTNNIHRLQEHMKKYPTNSKAKVVLKETIERRGKWLRYLRMWDYRRFEWVLEKLNLVYKPMPEKPYQITRKDSLRRLTQNHCNKLIRDKLDAYKKELKELQKDFYIEKTEKLIFIREEELTCGLKPTVTEDDIKLAKQKAEEI